MAPIRDSVAIKGTREGLTISIGSGDVDTVLHDLEGRLKTQGAFFQGGRVALRVGDRELDAEFITRVGELLSDQKMVLRTVVASHTMTQRAATELGLRCVADEVDDEPASAPAPSPEQILEQRQSSIEGGRAILYRRMVRSGQIVRHTGHIVVVGDVNIGGQVAAGGDLIVWGRLYGMAQAGAMGDKRAIICALEMAPMQLRIADVVARPSEDDRKGMTYPEVAYIKDDIIVVEPWDRVPRGV